MLDFKGKGWSLGICMLGLTACSQREGLAPVVELNWRETNSHVSQHIVTRGETLYAIAFRYDQDYRQLAAANHLYSPYSLRIGQAIRLLPGRNPIRTANTSRYVAPKFTNYSYTQRQRYSSPVHRGSDQWLWPARGRIVSTFVPEQGKKGLDIAGKKGDKIYAAGSGTVAYAGSGLAGYGNLIIIKHNNQYLTAYGNNAHNLVREGQSIKAGQMIADMGVIDRRFWGVHFEIRQAGKPVNPLSYLR